MNLDIGTAGAAPSNPPITTSLIRTLREEIGKRYPRGFEMLEKAVLAFRASDNPILEIPIELGHPAAHEMHVLLTADPLRQLCSRRFRAAFAVCLPQTILVAKTTENLGATMPHQVALLKKARPDQMWVKELRVHDVESHTALMGHVTNGHPQGWQVLREMIMNVHGTKRTVPVDFTALEGTKARSLLDLLRNTAIRAFLQETNHVRIDVLAPCNILVTSTRPLDGTAVDPKFTDTQLLQKQLDLFTNTAS